MKAAAIQMRSGDDPVANVAKALELVDRTDADLVVLPEVFVHPTKTDDGTTLDALKKRRRWIAGTWLADGYNTLFVVSPDGAVARYRKIHLFDVPGLGTESRYMKPGSEIVTATIGGFKVGLAICYDLRFPELFRAQAADLYLVPSAFTERTGRDHWEVLVRARAIENLAYVVAPNQFGEIPTGRTWGHSMIVDPWGRVLAEADGEGAAIAELDLNRVAEARKNLPALQHRRPELFRG